MGVSVTQNQWLSRLGAPPHMSAGVTDTGVEVANARKVEVGARMLG